MSHGKSSSAIVLSYQRCRIVAPTVAGHHRAVVLSHQRGQVFIEPALLKRSSFETNERSFETSEQSNTAAHVVMASEPPPPPPPPPLPPAAPRGGFGLAAKTNAEYEKTRKYINEFLTKDGKFPPFDELTVEHVEGPNLAAVIEGFGGWFSETQFKTHLGTWLSTDTKAIHYGKAKEMWKAKFHSHELWRDENWWTDVLKLFKRACDRALMDDPGTMEERKSEGIYRDLSSDTTSIRAKYLDLSVVDARTITMSMIRNGNAKAVTDLMEFNMCRNACGRAVEHSLVRWDEAEYDYNFMAPDFQWPIPKQLASQCMLFFHDRSIYSLDFFFSHGVFLLFGNAERPSSMPEARRPFVFPYLHNTSRDNVARRLTTAIRAHIPDKSREKNFTSRSVRKGVATGLQMHSDISPDERVARGGWSHVAGPSRNAEGYVEDTPCMSAPGGLAVAGWQNCHNEVVPLDVAWLGSAVMEDDGPVKRLLKEMFVIDVPELKLKGKLSPVTWQSFAAIIAAFNQLVADVGRSNPIVMRICKAAQSAKIDDPSVPEEPGPRWPTVLKHWSKTLSLKFKERNPDIMMDEASVAQQMVGLGKSVELLSRKVDRIETGVVERSAGVDEIMQLKTQNQLLLEQNQLLAEQVRLWQQAKAPPAVPTAAALPTGEPLAAPPVAAAPTVPPAARPSKRSAAPPAAAAATASLTAADILLEKPSSKKQRVNLDQALDGTPPSEQKLQGITVKEVLQHAWKEGHLEKLQHKSPLPSRDCLFNESFIPIHPVFKAKSEGAKFKDAMRVAAMTMEQADWTKLAKGELDDEGCRNLFDKVSTECHLTIHQLRIEQGHAQAGTTVSKRAQDTVSSVALKFQELKKFMTTEKAQGGKGMKTEDVERMVLKKIGKKMQRQLGIGGFFARK